MLKIKLARFGKRGQPHYRIVVTEQRSKRDGQYTAAIGTYVPTFSSKPLQLDTNAYTSWLEKGARPTPTVAALYTKALKQTKSEKAATPESSTAAPTTKSVKSGKKPSQSKQKSVVSTT